MLTAETKRHIDSARQVLVGKVPDPKQQIDQITNALIYKFMDDMDVKAVDAGGKASFFTGELEQYAWRKLMDPRKGSQDKLNMYTEALEKFSTAQQLPQLFRDIFRQAFLPYRAPETLNLFLKEIEFFDYNHSEELGNAFEYLLSIMGSQGDAGQFRTPRHIIDFIVDVIDPDKDDTILDPACGTAGFLISAYNHVVAKHDGVDASGKRNNEKSLTHQEKQKLMSNLVGYDISSGMVKLARVNMYLHGNNDPLIYEYDSLSSEERWGDNFDVILANPPFMSPKGGIRPHNKFSVQANRAEILFIDYIKEHINPNGRAAVIVPEGVIFGSAKANTQLRKLLVEDGLYAVVSLPVGIFNPYSATIKTSILFFDNMKAKESSEILFFGVENDGFDLGANRTKIDKNDLPEALDALRLWKSGVKTQSLLARWVKKELILNSSDYSLRPNSYEPAADYSGSKFPIVYLKDVCEIKTGKKNVNEGNPDGAYPFFTCAKEHTYSDGFSFDAEAVMVAGNGDVGAVSYYKGKFEAYQRTYVLLNFKNAIPKYIYYILKESLKEVILKQKLGNTMAYIKLGALQNFRLPLPKLEEQKNIVDNIRKYEEEIQNLEVDKEAISIKIKNKINNVWGDKPV